LAEEEDEQMRLLAVDKKRGWLRLAITNNIDLINLYRLVGKDDVVFQETTREVKKERATGAVDSERVSLKIGLSVEKKSADPLMKRVRFQGRIIFAEKDLDILKKYHTIQVGRGDVIEIESREKLPFFLKLVEDGGREIEQKIVAVSVDDEELAVALISGEGVRLLKSWRRSPASKRVGLRVEGEQEEVFDELVQLLKELAREERVKIALLGIDVHVDELGREIRRRDIGLHGLVKRRITTNIGGMDGLREALRRGALGEELKPLADAILVESALTAIVRSPEKVYMGLEEVAEACRKKRCQLVLAEEEFLWQNLENSTVNEVLSMAEKGLIDLRIILSSSEAADKLRSFGGIVCLSKRD